MPMKFVKFYSREDLQNNPQDIYVFGDNLTAVGLGGQAAACRGEPNAFGIPTKIAPSNHPDAFLFDVYLDRMRMLYQFLFNTLDYHTSIGNTVVWPEDGIGTGLADLPNKSPEIYALIQLMFEALKRRAVHTEAQG